ncbi:DUF397 domain-containing protein [Streptomyces sp. NPDC018000]|uniref:DUF397 domain-containing protein n=1 Tax=Streptomyces sp. NPDC018000 TaxID=3365028 RepID=UPI0037925A52
MTGIDVSNSTLRSRISRLRQHSLEIGSRPWHGSTGGDCVEVADGLPCAVPVRDSKNPDGPVLTIGADAWRHFVDALR